MSTREEMERESLIDGERMEMLSSEIAKERYREHIGLLRKCMAEYGGQPICLAFSGGVDSSLLLKMACDAAGKSGSTVYAVTFDTMLHPACDLENARNVAEELHAVHVVLEIDELKLEALRDNPVNRCYLCKRNLFETLRRFAEDRGISRVLDGTNADDLKVYRPGLTALKELGIDSPLALCQMTKEEVKRLAAEYGLSVAARPSTPCMATRLPYGAKLDYGLLKQIEEGEAYLRALIPGNIRLRVHDRTARIEVDEGQLSEAVRRRTEISKEMKRLGFDYVTLDLEGFRSGSMDLHVQ